MADVAKITADIAKLEKNLNNPALNDAMKKVVTGKLEGLKKQLTEAQATSVKAEEKQIAETNDKKKAAEEAIAKLKKGLTNTAIPDSAKASVRAKIAQKEKELEEMARVEAEAAKEKAAEVKEVKEAVVQVTEVIAEAKKTPVKKAGAPKAKAKPAKTKKIVTASKERTEQSKKHEKKYKGIIDELVAFIKGNKNLAVEFKGASRDSIQRDAMRHALKPGKRISKEGNTYYEYRRNRTDLTKRKKYPFFEEGGDLTEYKKGGITADGKGYDVSCISNFASLTAEDQKLVNSTSDIRAGAHDMLYGYKDDKLMWSAMITSDFDGKTCTINSIVEGYKKGGKVHQANPQGEHYTPEGDKKRHSKPAGWRFTNEFIASRTGKRLGLTDESKPTAEQIEKYRGKEFGNGGRYLYEEARADHSDKNFKRKLAEGGKTESNSNDSYIYEDIIKDTAGKVIYKKKFTDREIAVRVQDIITDCRKDEGAYENLLLEAGKGIDGALVSLDTVNKIKELIEGSHKKGGEIYQAKPQGEHYTKKADAKRSAKPAGWRFTDKFLTTAAAKSLGLNSRSKPTKQQIEKWRGKEFKKGERYLYEESRKDHSDVTARPPL